MKRASASSRSGWWSSSTDETNDCCCFTPLWAAAHLPHKGGDQPSQLFQQILKGES
jgi:hypothetical protein